MEDKLKARLTGAAILVALLVLVVPELFRGAATPTAPPSVTTPTPDNAAPLNSYQIDLQPGASSGAAASAADSEVATVTAPEGGAGGAGDAAPGSDTTSADTHASTTAPATERATTKAATSVATPATAKTAASAATPAKPSAAKPSAAKTPAIKSPAAKSAAAAATAPTAGRGWSVRVGMFSKRDNAQRLRQQLQAKGVTVAVSGPDGRGLYSVAGPKLPERSAAADWLKHVKALGFAGVLTEAP